MRLVETPTVPNSKTHLTIRRMKIRGQVCKKPPSYAIYGFQDGEGTEDPGDRPLVERQTDKRAAFSVSRRTTYPEEVRSNSRRKGNWIVSR